MVNHCGDIKAGARSSWSHLQSRVERRLCVHSWLSPLFPLSLYSSGPNQGMALPALSVTLSTSILMATDMPPGPSDSDNPSFRVSSQVIQAWGKLAITAHCINGTIWMVRSTAFGWQSGGFLMDCVALEGQSELETAFFLHWNIINIYVFRHEVMIHVKYMDECWRHWGNWKKRNKETYVYRSKYMAVRGWGEWGMYSYP